MGQTSLSQGFQMLEDGKLAAAERFFDEAAKLNPAGKTEMLCYARAIGLQDRPEEALSIFQELLLQYPGDYELGLNEAEAYMWLKRYDAALGAYQELLSRDSSNFVANLGCANAHSALKQHELSLKYIRTSLALEPDNKSATISKKYILLANSELQRNLHRFQEAEDYLQEILRDFPKDKEALINLAILDLMRQKPGKAANHYEQLREQEPYEALLGTSYTSLLLGRKGRSMRLARQAMQLPDRPDDLRAEISYINSLGARQQFTKAREIVDELLLKHPDQEQLILAKGRLKVWGEEFREGIATYALLDTVSNFPVLMSLAEADRAMGDRTAAIERIDQALRVQPMSLDAARLKAEIQRERATMMDMAYSVSTDVSGITARISRATISVPVLKKHRLIAGAYLRKLNEEGQEQTVRQTIFELGDVWEISPKTKIRGTVGAAVASNTDKDPKLLYGLKLDQKLRKYHHLGLGFNQELHNYTPALVSSCITMSHYSFTYSFARERLPGIYSQIMHSKQTDNNSRNLQFLSLYYSLFPSPVLKTGINLLHFSFEKSRPELYFSPQEFSSYEIFVQSDNLYVNRHRLKYAGMLGLGQQKIDQLNPQFTVRTELKLGYQLLPQIMLYGFHQYSSAAQTTAVGYSSTIVGLSLEARLFKQ